MLARGMIAAEDQRATGVFRWAHAARVPACLRRLPSSLDTTIWGNGGDDDQGAQTAVWRRIVETMPASDIELLTDLIVLAVWPSWLQTVIDRQPLTPAELTSRRRTLDAVRRLSASQGVQTARLRAR